MPELVSVVIPAYRAEAFIEETVQSVRAQTWRPMEVVIVDDCSPDGTAQVAERLAETLSDEGFVVRLLGRPANGGVADALSTGFASAQGAYVCWLSADDVFVDPRKIEKQVAKMRGGAQFAYAPSYLQGDSVKSSSRVSTHWSHRFSGVADWAFNRSSWLRVMGLMFENPINGSTVMMRAGLMSEFGGFDKFEATGQNLDSDGDLWLRFSALGVVFATTRGSAVLYRQHAGQGSSAREAEWRRDCEIVRVRVLLAFEELDLSAILLDRGWPALWLATRGRYSNFPHVTRAVCEAGRRTRVGGISGRLLARLEGSLRDEGLWDDQEYSVVDRAARSAMDSPEFIRFRERLRERSR